MKFWNAYIVFLIISLPLLSQNKIEKQKRFSIYFSGGSYIIDNEQAEKLSEFIGQFESIEEYHISIHSHTDNIGGKSYNKWLSQMRSRSAIEELIKNNVPEMIISIQDFGQHNPVYDNDTWLGRLKNRRVDIIFWPVVM